MGFKEYKKLLIKHGIANDMEINLICDEYENIEDLDRILLIRTGSHSWSEYLKKKNHDTY